LSISTPLTNRPTGPGKVFSLDPLKILFVSGNFLSIFWGPISADLWEYNVNLWVPIPET
jgi:hypothetical protein